MRDAVMFAASAQRGPIARKRREALTIKDCDTKNSQFAGFEAYLQNKTDIKNQITGKEAVQLKAKVDKDLCSGCGACESECPKGAISVGDIAVVNEDLCDGCGKCVEVCPLEALSLK